MGDTKERLGRELQDCVSFPLKEDAEVGCDFDKIDTTGCSRLLLINFSGLLVPLFTLFLWSGCCIKDEGRNVYNSSSLAESHNEAEYCVLDVMVLFIGASN